MHGISVAIEGVECCTPSSDMELFCLGWSPVCSSQAHVSRVSHSSSYWQLVALHQKSGEMAAPKKLTLDLKRRHRVSQIFSEERDAFHAFVRARHI